MRCQASCKNLYCRHGKNMKVKLLEIESLGDGGDCNVYVCSYYDGDEYHLIDKNNRDDMSVIEVLVGQMSGKLKRNCIGLERLLTAVKPFCNNWSVYNNPDWEMEKI